MTNVDNSDLLRAILSKLDRGDCPDRQWPDSRGEYWPLCPFPDHGGDHRHGSFHVSERGYYCHACGAKGGLYKLAKHLGISQSQNGRTASKLGEVVATYDYQGADGRLLFQVLRYQPKTFRQRRPDGAGGWAWNLNGVQRVLYRLPELLAADPTTPVYIVEGEKDADRLHSLGLLATTNAQGAGKWRPGYADSLRGRPVAILPDNDKPGQDHAKDIARSLLGVADSVKVINLPGLAPKSDVSDWLQDGHTAGDLEELYNSTPEWTPPQSPSEPITAEKRPDSAGLGDVFSPEGLVEALEAVQDAIGAYDMAGQFAELPAGEYAKAKAILKERLGAALNLNDLDRAVNEARRSLRRWEASLEVIIVTDRPLRDISTDGLQALIKANEPPVLFVRSGKLARVRADEKGQPLIEELSEATLRGRLARVSDWARVTENGERHCPPPLEVVRDLLALGAWPFPALEAITEAPCLRPDGTILEQPGYDPATQLVYWPAEGLTVPSVPTTPTNEDVARALDLWHEATEGFPFVDDAAKANALALALTPILRPAIAGKVPLALIDAPQAGTGKGLLFELITMIATGRPASMMNAPDSDEEWRKAITSHLLTGTTMIGIDNVERPLNAPALAMALTAPIWKDRLLGRNEAVSLPQRATWVATGNNLRLGLDLPRRCYWIRLDAKMARPWQREQFKHPDLIRWATQERGNLLWALLTLARSWYAAGQPAPDVRPIGSFEDWTRTVGGVLQHAGIKGFLGNLEEMYTKADEDGPEWYEFLSAWYQELGDRTLTISQLMKHLSEGQALREALPDDLASAMANPNGSFQKRLGHALKSRVDKRYGDEGLHVERASDEKCAKVARWRVRTAGFAGFCGEATTQSQANTPPLGNAGENDKGGILYEQWPTRTPQNPANPATPEQQWEEIGDEPQEPGGTFRINMTTGKRERLRQGPGNAAEPTEPCRLCGKTDWIWSPAGHWVCGTCPPVAVAAEG